MAYAGAPAAVVPAKASDAEAALVIGLPKDRAMIFRGFEPPLGAAELAAGHHDLPWWQPHRRGTPVGGPEDFGVLHTAERLLRLQRLDEAMGPCAGGSVPVGVLRGPALEEVPSIGDDGEDSPLVGSPATSPMARWRQFSERPSFGAVEGNGQEVVQHQGTGDVGDAGGAPGQLALLFDSPAERDLLFSCLREAQLLPVQAEVGDP